MTARWQNWASALLGVAVFLMPWVLADLSSTLASPLSDGANWNLWIVGALTVVVSLATAADYRPWEEWGSTIFGAWLVASPWVFGFTAATAMAWSVGIAGGALVLFGLWSLVVNSGSRSSLA